MYGGVKYVMGNGHIDLSPQPTLGQTDTTENITYATPLAGNNKNLSVTNTPGPSYS